MTTISRILEPSVYMQKSFFHRVEKLRGKPIGEDNFGRDRYAIRIRIYALAHALFQACYATVALLPLAAVSAYITISRPKIRISNHPNDSLVKKVWLMVRQSYHSLSQPTISSLGIAIDTRHLSTIHSTRPHVSAEHHMAHFVVSLAPLPKMRKVFKNIERARYDSGALDRLSLDARKYLNETTFDQQTLSHLDSGNWRQHFISMLVINTFHTLSEYNDVFNLSSDFFLIPLIEALTITAANPSKDDMHLLESSTLICGPKKMFPLAGQPLDLKNHEARLRRYQTDPIQTI